MRALKLDHVSVAPYFRPFFIQIFEEIIQTFSFASPKAHVYFIKSKVPPRLSSGRGSEWVSDRLCLLCGSCRAGLLSRGHSGPQLSWETVSLTNQIRFPVWQLLRRVKHVVVDAGEDVAGDGCIWRESHLPETQKKKNTGTETGNLEGFLKFRRNISMSRSREYLVNCSN